MPYPSALVNDINDKLQRQINVAPQLNHLFQNLIQVLESADYEAISKMGEDLYNLLLLKNARYLKSIHGTGKKGGKETKDPEKKIF